MLNSIAITAAKYGRAIEPLLSLSIDFYVRLFIRVVQQPAKVKYLARYFSNLHICLILAIRWSRIIVVAVDPG